MSKTHHVIHILAVYVGSPFIAGFHRNPRPGVAALRPSPPSAAAAEASLDFDRFGACRVQEGDLPHDLRHDFGIFIIPIWPSQRVPNPIPLGLCLSRAL